MQSLDNSPQGNSRQGEIRGDGATFGGYTADGSEIWLLPPIGQKYVRDPFSSKVFLVDDPSQGEDRRRYELEQINDFKKKNDDVGKALTKMETEAVDAQGRYLKSKEAND